MFIFNYPAVDRLAHVSDDTSMRPVLAVKNLTKIFHNVQAVNNLSFSLNPGEIYSLIGPNGAGKTTTIKLIAGLLQPTSGTITIENHNIITEPVHAKALYGYIPDDPFMYERITGLELLTFVGTLHNIPKDKLSEKINQLSTLFPLGDILHQPFESYSRGNKQKISILAALIHEPKLLLIDEPIVGLDPHSSTIAKTLFLNFTKKGGSILLSTHTLTFAESITHRIGIIEHGRLIQEGSIEELKHIAKSKNATLEQLYRSLVQAP